MEIMALIAVNTVAVGVSLECSAQDILTNLWMTASLAQP